MKDIARRAYEAYCANIGTTPDFNSLTASEQLAWEAAIREVIFPGNPRRWATWGRDAHTLLEST